MNFKQFFFKKIIPSYCMIVTLLNVGMLVVGKVCYPDTTFGYGVFLSPLLFGVIGCMPVLIDFWFGRKAHSRKVLWLQTLIELAALELCIIGSGALLIGFDSLQIVVTMSCLAAVIFVAVTAIQYVQDNHMCHEMNQVLDAMHQSE
jgi:hypothetical protein